MTIAQPPLDTVWKVSKSFVLEHPDHFQSDSLKELRRKVGEFCRIANAGRESRKRIRDLNFRYEADENDVVTTVHVYFTGYTLKQLRLFKLERQCA